MRRLTLAVLIVLICAAASSLPAAAHADGDPASDVLATQSLFAPVDAGLSVAQLAELSRLLAAAQRSHFPIRVAIIPTAFDLGAVTEFWRKPDVYAHFLGVELSLTYDGPLLIVMPNGFGLNWPGHSTASTSSVLARVPVKASGPGILKSVQTAIRDLAASAGTTVSAKTTNAAEKHGGHGAAVIIGVLAAVALAILAFVVGIRRRRSNATVLGRASVANRTAIIGLLGWLVPGLGLLIAVIVIVHALGSSGRPRLPAGRKLAENEPYVFPFHQKRAPSFELRDQDGQPVSVAAYRGHPLLITFVDPQSREGVPHAVQTLDQAERELPESQRPEILAVSVNASGDTRANLVQDLRRWHLLPQWRWAVGSPKQLASVWHHYYAVVDVISKKIAGTTVHEVSQSKMAYLIDGDGYERVLFGWPYGARELERTLRHQDGAEVVGP